MAQKESDIEMQRRIINIEESSFLKEAFLGELLGCLYVSTYLLSNERIQVYFILCYQSRFNLRGIVFKHMQKKHTDASHAAGVTLGTGGYRQRRKLVFYGDAMHIIRIIYQKEHDSVTYGPFVKL